MPQNVIPKTQRPKAGYAMDDANRCVHPTPELEGPEYKPAGKLKGRAALVTGGDSGIGAAVAIAFAKEGADVAVTYYDSKEDADAVVKRIETLGAKAIALGGDVGNEEAAHKMVATTAGAFDRLDILVNNAGEQTPCGSIGQLSQAQLVRTFQTNLFSMFYLVKAALPHLPAGGAIINTTSVTAYRGSKNLMDYAATKGTIVSFTRSLAINDEILEKGIRVNGVAPGPIWTPLNPASYGPDDEKVLHFGEDTPMGRAGQPYECAPAYVYLACADSSYMTGQILHINGGEVVGG